MCFPLYVFFTWLTDPFSLQTINMSSILSIKKTARPPADAAAQINSQHVRVAAVKADPHSVVFFFFLVLWLQPR